MAAEDNRSDEQKRINPEGGPEGRLAGAEAPRTGGILARGTATPRRSGMAHQRGTELIRGGSR